jgi:NAD(P)-dependent dehydrogenase (short-subunit alcohol dehydrogenase family)
VEINYDNKVVLITGASTGIGAEFAKAFAASGAKVVINYLNSKASADHLVQEIQEAGGTAIAIKADVTSSSDVKTLFETVIEKFEKIDILINNAGALVKRMPFAELQEEVWDQTYNLNVKSVFLCSKEAYPIMKQNGGGSIINITSIAARNGGGPGALHYSSAKGAVLTLTKGMAKEFLPAGIRVNAISPGVISTPFQDKFTPSEIREGFLKGIPMGREGLPAEIVGTAMFLASDFASYICGETIEVNGGQLMD